MRLSSSGMGVVMPGKQVGNATIMPSRTNWCPRSFRYALISGEFGSNFGFVCIAFIR